MNDQTLIHGDWRIDLVSGSDGDLMIYATHSSGAEPLELPCDGSGPGEHVMLLSVLSDWSK